MKYLNLEIMISDGKDIPRTSITVTILEGVEFDDNFNEAMDAYVYDYMNRWQHNTDGAYWDLQYEEYDTHEAEYIYDGIALMRNF